ncbi:unnamed protein product [Rodentolepis nana]|uniref:C2 NT-type domain-containing protein n=1 Tax=Rodentolepis nana TaxID=102285 RepID=A0A0R3TS99_RODNA|nr:unnamed protein product [Rodentolepis nana]
MACVPLTSNKRKFTFEATVNLECLMAVPYVNAVFFTKMRLLNSRNYSHYSKSSHTFQCKVRIDPDSNILETSFPKYLKFVLSIVQESEGGKSFHKIGFVIVDLSCFVASGFVRCRRRYLLNGYDGNRRRDNSLLVVSFTCQQNFGSTCFRL